MTWPGWEQFNATPAKPHKYGAKAVTVDGMRFASKREARRWQELTVLQTAGQIRTLERQVRIPLHALGGGLVGHYVADFRYFDVVNGREVVEDAKGMRLPLYQWKAKHVKAEHGVDIQEV